MNKLIQFWGNLRSSFWFMPSLMVAGSIALAVVLIVSISLLWVLPFGVYAQYSIIIHTVVGVVSLLPLVAAIYLHWQRRKGDAPAPIARTALLAIAVLVVCLFTGLLITALALFGTWVPDWVDTVHLVSALVLGALIAMHLAPIVARYGKTEASPRRAPRAARPRTCRRTVSPGATTSGPSSPNDRISGHRLAGGRPLHASVMASTAASLSPSGRNMPNQVAVASILKPQLKA